MSTYLVICQDLARECGVAGGASASPNPTAVTGQVGELKRVVNYVEQAWTEIQNRHPNWRWMRRAFTVTTSSGDDSYAFGDVTDVDASAVIDRFAHWRVTAPDDPPKSYLSSAGVATEQWLNWASWDWFKRIYRIGTQNNSEPAHIAIDPQNNLVLGPKPNGAYVITGDFQRGAQILAANGDTPDMPARYHDLIMYTAMKKYALFHGAPELLEAAKEGIRVYTPQLEKDQLPEIFLGQPMA